MKKHLFLKVLLALFPAVIFEMNYAWMTGNKAVGIGFLLLWALIIWSVWQMTEKNHIIERLFRETEIAFFLLPLSAIVLTFVLGAETISDTSDQFEKVGTAIGTAIGGAFIVGLSLVIGIVGGIVMHLITNNYDRKAEASGVKQPETFANKHGVILSVVGLFLLAIILGIGASVEVKQTTDAPRTVRGQGTATTAPVPATGIEMKLVSKQFTKADIMRRIYSDSLDFAIEFTNKFPKDIRAFTGYVTFSDLFDRKIIDMTITYEDGLRAGETKTWNGSMDYNQFMDNHERIASISMKDLQSRFTLQQVVYADGTKDQF